MAKKIVDVIVDIETVQIYGKQKNRGMIISKAIFNVGVTIQHNGNIINSEQHGIKDIWEYPEHLITDFYRMNFTEDDFDSMYEGFDEYFKDYFIPMLKDLKNKGVKVRIWSFNAGFDRAGFEENLKLYQERLPDGIHNNWFCIMVLASNVLTNNPAKYKKYINFLIETEYNAHKEKNSKHLYTSITQKGNFKTSAEAIYRFISNNPDFIEVHKGKEDSQIEGEILEWCKKEKGWSKLNKTPEFGAWTLVNSNARPFEAKSSIIADQEIAEETGQSYPWYLLPKNIEAYEWLLERAVRATEEAIRQKEYNNALER